MATDTINLTGIDANRRSEIAALHDAVERTWEAHNTIDEAGTSIASHRPESLMIDKGMGQLGTKADFLEAAVLFSIPTNMEDVLILAAFIVAGAEQIDVVPQDQPRRDGVRAAARAIITYLSRSVAVPPSGPWLSSIINISRSDNDTRCGIVGGAS